MIRVTVYRGVDTLGMSAWQQKPDSGVVFAREAADDGVQLVWTAYGFELSVLTLETDETRIVIETALAQVLVDSFTARWRVGSLAGWDFAYCPDCLAGSGCSHLAAGEQASAF